MGKITINMNKVEIRRMRKMRDSVVMEGMRIRQEKKKLFMFWRREREQGKYQRKYKEM